MTANRPYVKGYRDPTRQQMRWEAQADAWTCPNECGHGVESHKEYPSSWERGTDGYLVEVKHPDYLPGRFVCLTCLPVRCEIDGGH